MVKNNQECVRDHEAVNVKTQFLKEEFKNESFDNSDLINPKVERIEILVESGEPLPHQVLEESAEFFDTSDFIEPKIEIIEHGVESSEPAPTTPSPPPQKKIKFDCDICAYETNDWFQLWIHNQEKHLEMSCFSCDLCTVECESKQAIFDHRLSVHAATNNQ